MIKRLNRISVKYAVAFIGVALALLAVVAVDMALVHSLKNRMTEFSGTFNKATSAVLNADRDLYQAYVAELEYLRSEPQSTAAEAQRKDFEENAQQAYDRMHTFSEELAAYPDITAKLTDFEPLYSTWLERAHQVLASYSSGDAPNVVSRHKAAALAAFGKLREVYDVAGAAADAKVVALQASTLARVKTQEYAVIAFSLVVALIAIAIALAGPLFMSRAIRQVTARIREITEGDGDLAARIRTKRGDEIGDLAHHFNAFITRIDQTFQSVRESTEGVSSASNQIAMGSQDLAARTEQSASNLQETSASMEEITATVTNTSDAAEQANELVQSTVVVAREGEQAMQQMESTMDDISTSANQINEITTLIDGIAFQTNLLALNASVEAARAGEHGRGFAVVAQEVRSLASRASDASRDIRGLIDTSVAHTQSGATLVKNTGVTMQKIVKSVERVTDVIGEISTGAREQSQGIAQINTAVTELDNTTQHNAAMVEQTSAAALHMREQAQNLKALIASFKLSTDLPPDPAGSRAEPVHARASHAALERRPAGPTAAHAAA